MTLFLCNFYYVSNIYFYNKACNWSIGFLQIMNISKLHHILGSNHSTFYVWNFQVSFPYKFLVLKMRFLLLTKYMWKSITFHCLPSLRCDAEGMSSCLCISLWYEKFPALNLYLDIWALWTFRYLKSVNLWLPLCLKWYLTAVCAWLREKLTVVVEWFLVQHGFLCWWLWLWGCYLILKLKCYYEL
jgi:hypothetical protein